VQSSKMRLFSADRYYLQYEVPHWLYISKFTRFRTVSRRQHGSCSFLNSDSSSNVSTSVTHNIVCSTTFYFSFSYAVVHVGLILIKCKKKLMSLQYRVRASHIQNSRSKMISAVLDVWLRRPYTVL